MNLIIHLIEDLIVHATGRAVEDVYDHGTPKRRKVILIVGSLVVVPLLAALLILGIVKKNGVLIFWPSVLLLISILWLALRIREYRGEFRGKQS